jgi:hypothetical protein
MMKATFRTIVAAALASALALPACLVEEVKVGGADGDGGRGGAPGAPDPALGCVGDEGPPQDPAVARPQFRVIDPFSRLPVTGAQVRACAVLDTGCSNALTNYQTVDADGVASLLLPTNQSAYLEIIENGRVPMLIFFSPREVARGGGGRTLLMFTADQMQALLRDVGGFEPGQPSNPVLIGAALDCGGRAREKVSFSLDPAAVRSEDTGFFYTNDDNIPVASMTQTSQTGMFGATNLNEGLASLSLAANVSPANYAEFKVHFRRGWLTQAFVSP